MIPNRAYLVTSKPDPAFAVPGTKWDEIKVRSIHTCPHEAKAAAKELRKAVFARLAREGDEPEEYITRLLAYRQTIKITICRLDKIAVAVCE